MEWPIPRKGLWYSRSEQSEEFVNCNEYVKNYKCTISVISYSEFRQYFMTMYIVRKSVGSHKLNLLGALKLALAMLLLVLAYAMLK